MHSSYNAQVIAELESLECDGVIQPADVVAFARETRTALHAYFEWDDSKAAELHRLDQARRVIRVMVIRQEQDDGPVVPIRAFVSLTPDRASGGGYRRIASVVSDKEQYQQLLADALAEINNLQRKFVRIRELQPVWDAAGQVQVIGGRESCKAA